MAEAILKYDLNDPDERLEHKRVVKATDAFLAMWDFYAYLRREIKHGDHSDEGFQLLEKVRERFFEELEIHGINLDQDVS